MPNKVERLTVFEDEAMETSVGTYYSPALEIKRSRGFTSLLVLTSAGSLAITFEVSDDSDNWYVPYDVDDNDLSGVHPAVTEDKWVVFSTQLARWIRFKFVLTVGDSTVSAYYRQSENIV